jgi:hypothetical protein
MDGDEDSEHIEPDEAGKSPRPETQLPIKAVG